MVKSRHRAKLEELCRKAAFLELHPMLELPYISCLLPVCQKVKNGLHHRDDMPKLMRPSDYELNILKRSESPLVIPSVGCLFIAIEKYQYRNLCKGFGSSLGCGKDVTRKDHARASICGRMCLGMALRCSEEGTPTHRSKS